MDDLVSLLNDNSKLILFCCTICSSKFTQKYLDLNKHKNLSILIRIINSFKTVD